MRSFRGGFSFTLFILSIYSTMFPIRLCNPLAANFCIVNSAIQSNYLLLLLLLLLLIKMMFLKNQFIIMILKYTQSGKLSTVSSLATALSVVLMYQNCYKLKNKNDYGLENSCTCIISSNLSQIHFRIQITKFTVRSFGTIPK